MESQKNYIFHNVSKTQNCLPDTFYKPSTVEELQHILKLARDKNKKVKVVGTGHSFSDISCTDGFLISIQKFNKLIKVNKETKCLTIQGGMILKSINEILAENQLALPVIGSVADFSIAGAISTGAHGSSTKCGTLSSIVTELKLVTASGELLTCNRQENEEIFHAAACSLGSLGIIVEVTLQCVDAFDLEFVKYGEDLDKILMQIDDKLVSNDFFEFFWYPHTNKVVVWEHNKTHKERTETYSWFWDQFIAIDLLMLLYWIGTFATFIIPWINIMYFYCFNASRKVRVNRNDKVLNYVCPYYQYVMEYSIPSNQVVTALTRLQLWVDKSGYKAHAAVEVRFVKSDDLYLSTATGDNDRCFINIVCNKVLGKEYPRKQYWDQFERIMVELGGRPHWAKDFSINERDFQRLYPKWNEFKAIRKQLDPNDMFMNSYLQRVFT